MSAIGSVIVIGLMPFLAVVSVAWHLTGVWATDLQRQFLPTGLRYAWELTGVGLVTKAYAAEAELTINGMRTSAHLAARIRTHSELRLTGRLVLQSGFCHISSP